MTSPPARRPEELARRGVRLAAGAVIALVVAALTALADIGDRLHPAVLLPAAGVLGAAGWWRERDRDAPSALGTSGVVAAAALAAVGVQAWLTPVGGALDAFLAVTGAVFLAAGYLRRERRLVTLGLLQHVVVLARSDEVFQHCLIATEVAVPVPRLDPVLGLALAALVLGTWHRRRQHHVEAGRGFEVTGLILLHVVLLAKAAELPGLEALCGVGDPLDAGWMLAGVAAGTASLWYGVEGRDAVWAGAGIVAVAAQGLAATSLTGEPVWAVIAALPLGYALFRAERAGVGWPHGASYGRPVVGRRDGTGAAHDTTAGRSRTGHDA